MGLLLLGLLGTGCATTQGVRQSVEQDGPGATESSEASSPPALVALSAGRWNTLLRLETTLLALPQRGGEGSWEGFAQLTPTLVVDGGERFGLNLGAPVRLRLWGGEAGSGLMRQEDWDSLSDWGQWVRTLKLRADATPVALWVGGMDSFTLLSGHLVRRYSNGSNPDYHPAGAFLSGTWGPLYAEAFASDVLGARLLGAEVALDLAHVFAGPPKQPGRYTLALSAVRDWGRAEGPSPEVTLMHLDGTAVVLVRPGWEIHVLAGWGGHPGEGGAWGGVAGVGADAVTPTLDTRVRLEVRRQHGGFRQGYFGPGYELTRFQRATPAEALGADVPLLDGYSAFSEFVMGWDGVRLGELVQRHLELSVAVEVFTWGRIDVEGRLAVQLFHRSIELGLRGLAMGLRKPGALYQGAGDLRWRFASRLYAVGQAGTQMYPTAGGMLHSGAFASIGLGVDNAR